MAKEELLEFNGTVTEVLPDGNYRVTLDNEHVILAYMSGKMRKFRIRTGVGDRVVVEVSPSCSAPQPSLRRKPHAVWSGPMTTSPERPAGSVDPKLLEILVCPLTKGPLEYDAEKQELISRSAKLAYPIRDGIPIMLPEEARRLD